MRLQRAYCADVALGVLRDDDGTVYFTTFEDKPIPAGTYTAKFCDHPQHGMAWELQNVPGRTAILIHVGNDERDSEGCILVGLGFAQGARAITGSQAAYKRLLRFLRRLDTMTIHVADPV